MIYIFTQNIWAGESIIVLETMNNAGISVKREVMMVDKKNAVIINGEKLNAIEVITQSEYLKSLSTFVKNNLNNCQQGKFKHLYQSGKILKKEEGCLDSERYKRLSESFKNLKKDKVTE